MERVALRIISGLDSPQRTRSRMLRLILVPLDQHAKETLWSRDEHFIGLLDVIWLDAVADQSIAFQ